MTLIAKCQPGCRASITGYCCGGSGCINESGAATYFVSENIGTLKKDEAIAFAEWVNLNFIKDQDRGYYSKFHDGSHGKSHITPKFYTIAELYQIFQEAKGQPT